MTFNEYYQRIEEETKKAEAQLLMLYLINKSIQLIKKMITEATPSPSESGGEDKENNTPTPTGAGAGCLEKDQTPSGEDEGRGEAASL